MNIKSIINIFKKDDIIEIEKPLFSIGESLDTQPIGKELVAKIKANAQASYNASLETLIKEFLHNKVNHELFIREYGLAFYESTIQFMEEYNSLPKHKWVEELKSYKLLHCEKDKVDSEYQPFVLENFFDYKLQVKINDDIYIQNKLAVNKVDLATVITPDNYVKEKSKSLELNPLNRVDKASVENFYVLLDSKVDFLVDFIYQSIKDAVSKEFKAPDFDV